MAAAIAGAKPLTWMRVMSSAPTYGERLRPARQQMQTPVTLNAAPLNPIQRREAQDLGITIRIAAPQLQPFHFATPEG